MKILFIIGTHPEVIKMASVLEDVRESEKLSTVICVTGQHKSMILDELDTFGFKADYCLDIMSDGYDLCDVAAVGLKALKKVINEVEPDMVLVQGDTTTAFIGALAAFYCNVKVGHIEAGLRTFNKEHPYPEEVHRCLISEIADWHFCPTERAVSNLNEKRNVFLTGNTVIDALKWIKPKSLNGHFPDGPFVLVTLHRRESFGEPLKRTCGRLKQIVEQNNVYLFVILHTNPNVNVLLINELGMTEKIFLLPFLDYASFVALMNKCLFIITDSGGVQEEAAHLGKPVLTVRSANERQESIAAGCAWAVGMDSDELVRLANELLQDPDVYEEMAQKRELYGDGEASKRIVEVLESI